LSTESIDTPGSSAQKSWLARDLLLIAALAGTLYLAGNGRISIWDRDEAWYAETTREMLRSGDYVVPRFNDTPRYRKPVLVYWLMAASFSVFGDNEFGARFVSAVAGTITCLVTYRLGTRMGGRAVGLAAALMLAVCPMMLVESKLATTDAVLAAAFTGAMACLWELHVAGPSWRWSLGFWFLIGVAALTKGPIGPALLGLAVLTWLILSRQWSVLRRLRWLPGLLVATAVVLPWCVAIYLATDGEFYRYVIHHEALGHSLRTMEHHVGFPGYYVAIGFLGLLPWSFGLALALASVRRWARQNGPGSFLLGWTIGPLLLIELMRSKLPHYYLPAFPALSLLIARGLVQFWAEGQRTTQSALGWLRWLRVASLATYAFAVGGVLAWFAFDRAPAPTRVPLVAAAAVMIAGAVISVACFLARRDVWAWSVNVGVSWCVGLIVAVGVLPRANDVRVARAAAAALADAAGNDTPIVLFGFREPSLVYYLREPVPSLGSVKQLSTQLAKHGPVVTLLRDSDLKKLAKQSNVCIELCERVDATPIRGVVAQSAYVARISAAAATRETATDHAARRDSDGAESAAPPELARTPLLLDR